MRRVKWFLTTIRRGTKEYNTTTIPLSPEGKIFIAIFHVYLKLVAMLQA